MSIAKSSRTPLPQVNEMILEEDSHNIESPDSLPAESSVENILVSGSGTHGYHVASAKLCGLESMSSRAY